jgi:hypothetical protein
MQIMADEKKSGESGKTSGHTYLLGQYFHSVENLVL